MDLSNELISQFAQLVKPVKEKKEATVNGTVVAHEGSMRVKLDGSEILTPVVSTACMKNGDRVTVLIKNHTATVTGNITSPSASSDDVENIDKEIDGIGNKITEFEVAIGDKVSVKDFEAEVGRIDNLVSENVFIKDKLTATEAEIGKLTAGNATITGKLEAAEAEIGKLKADNVEITGKLEANQAEIKDLTADNVTIKGELSANQAEIHNLKVDYGDFKVLTTDKLTAIDADIKKLDTEKLSATEADIKYAKIDFANIGEAAIEKLFADSGIIKDLIISGGHVTGELVGVTIKGDLIEAGTLVADKLVIKGSDGLYYKLNASAETIEAQQTEYNSINGKIIVAKSITASKINVDDIVAFNATLGGLNLKEGSIYSGLKESIDNPISGFYLDKEGQMALGNSTNYVKFFKDVDGTYRVKISASEIKFGSSSQNIEEAFGETIKSTEEQFYQSDSPTELIGGEWVTASPEWIDGKYLWRRSKVTYGDNSSNYIPSQNGICISGNTGEQGIPGLQGEQGIPGPAGPQGEQGIQGETGQNGKDAVTLHMLSSNGNLFKNSMLATTLTITIIVGDEMITSSKQMYAKFGSHAKIVWEQKRFGEDIFTPVDPSDNRLSDNGFIMTLTTTDVYTQTTFNCSIDY